MFALPRGAAVLAALCLSSIYSHAALVSFQRVTDNASIDVSGDFSLQVTDLGGQALLEFGNADNFEGFITEIYIQDGVESLEDVEFMATLSSDDVVYRDGARPARPPGLRPFTPTYSFNPRNPAPRYGIKENQIGAFVATYSGTYEDFESAIVSGEVSFAIHAQGLQGGESDTFVGFVVPEPGSALLALIGLGALLRRRRS